MPGEDGAVTVTTFDTVCPTAKWVQAGGSSRLVVEYPPTEELICFQNRTDNCARNTCSVEGSTTARGSSALRHIWTAILIRSPGLQSDGSIIGRSSNRPGCLFDNRGTD